MPNTNEEVDRKGQTRSQELEAKVQRLNATVGQADRLRKEAETQTAACGRRMQELEFELERLRPLPAMLDTTKNDRKLAQDQADAHARQIQALMSELRQLRPLKEQNQHLRLQSALDSTSDQTLIDVPKRLDQLCSDLETVLENHFSLEELTVYNMSSYYSSHLSTLPDQFQFLGTFIKMAAAGSCSLDVFLPQAIHKLCLQNIIDHIWSPFCLRKRSPTPCAADSSTLLAVASDVFASSPQEKEFNVGVSALYQSILEHGTCLISLYVVLIPTAKQNLGPNRLIGGACLLKRFGWLSSKVKTKQPQVQSIYTKILDASSLSSSGTLMSGLS